MRILLAFIITVIIYMVLIALYLLYFQNIKLSTPKKESEHIIKIDIRDIPRYVEKVVPKVPKQEATKEIKKEPKKRVTKKNISKKNINKKVTPKKVTPKKKIKKKVIAKKIIPKKTVKKREAVKKIEPKTPKKTVIEPSSPVFMEKEFIQKEIEEYIPEIIEVEEESLFEEEHIPKEVVEDEIIYEYLPQESIEEIVIQELIIDDSTALLTDDVIAEEEMLYIPDPIISESEPSKIDNSLSSILGQSSTLVRNRPKSPLIQKLYGASFDGFTPIQKRFIVDKLSSIHRITQSTLTRRGYPAGAVAMQTGQEGENIVSFDLHPNGDISNLRLEREIGYRALDENTLQTIRIAYKDYPYPRETTHIVFYVEYSIFGY